MYAGGPLATGFGDQLASAGVTVTSMYGGTESGAATRFWPPANRRPEDWAWLAMADRAHPRWVDAGDGQYELQLLVCPLVSPNLPNLVLISGVHRPATRTS